MSVVSRKTVHELLTRLSSRRPVALCTVFRARGSSPARIGARMVVDASGACAGTVGGSEMEWQTEQRGVDMLRRGESGIYRYDLQYKKPDAIDVACGGAVEILIEAYDGRSRPSAADLAEAWLKLMEGRQPALVTQVVGSSCGMSLGLWSVAPWNPQVAKLPVASVTLAEGHGVLSHAAPHQHGPAACRQPVEVFAEFVHPGPFILLVGGGHINRELAAELDRLEYGYSVLDDRPGMTSRDRFPGAAERSSESIPAFFGRGDLDRFTHAVICSHSQENDFHATRALLERRFGGYIGVIGSRSKRKDFHDRLKAAGLSDSLIERVEIPIGTDVHAQTVPEIALSIAGSLVRSFRPAK